VRVRLTPEARADVAEARRWYRQRNPALDARFLDAVEECVSQIIAHSESGPIVEGPVRRLLLRGFPYGFFYRLYPDEAVVIACLHGARSPQAWQRRGAGS
jgi:plasmid stabilization system protein ParE